MTQAPTAADLAATAFIDADHPRIRALVAAHGGTGSPRERAVRLYYAVRDAVPYDLRHFRLERETFVASHCLTAAGSYCVPKAVTLAAAARASGIPARLFFADVRNHLASPRVVEMMGTDVFQWHACTLLHLDGRWVKATPAFDPAFCARFGVAALDFDGETDSVFQPYDGAGRRHMEYVRERGSFDDMPFEAFRDAMLMGYPRFVATMAEERTARGF